MTSLIVTWLALAMGMNASPGVRVSAGQFLAQDMNSTYGVFPELGLSACLERTTHVAVMFELCADYARSYSWTGTTNLVTCGLRVGPEFRSSPADEFYFTPGLEVVHAAEQYPGYDTVSGVIGSNWYQGTAIGFFSALGVQLVPAGAWALNVELGIDLAAIPTARPLDDYYGYYDFSTYMINRSSISLGLVLRKRARTASGGMR
jgi:hypothetical protein